MACPSGWTTSYITSGGGCDAPSSCRTWDVNQQKYIDPGRSYAIIYQRCKAPDGTVQDTYYSTNYAGCC